MALSSYTNYSYRGLLAQYGFYQRDFDYTQFKIMKYVGKKVAQCSKFLNTSG
jgi:hypothetical protein